MLGKFKKSLREKCPLCNNILEIRTRHNREIRRGVEVDAAEDYICCSNSRCYYEREIEKKKKRSSRKYIEDEDIIY